MPEVDCEIRQFLVDNFLFGKSDDTLDNDGSFLEHGIIDSTGVLELVHFLEAKYGIKVDDDELVPANLDSISNLVRFINLKTQAVT